MIIAISIFYISMPSREEILAKLCVDSSYGATVINSEGCVFRLKAFYPFLLTPLRKSYLVILGDDGAWVSVSFREKTKDFVYDQFAIFGKEGVRVSEDMDVSCLSEMMIDPEVLEFGMMTYSQDSLGKDGMKAKCKYGKNHGEN